MTIRRAKGPRADAARQRLDKLTADYDHAVVALDAARKALAQGIVEILTDRDLGPSEVADHVPYDRQHVRRIAEAGGVPPARPPRTKRTNEAERSS